MAVLSVDEARKFVRQPAVWVSPTAYIAASANKANIKSQIAAMHERRVWHQDVINPAIQDPADAGPNAVAYDLSVVAPVADTPYRPATSGEAARSIAIKSIVCGCYVPLNYLALNNDDEPQFSRRGQKSTAERVELAALIDEARGELERQIVNGDAISNPAEFSGYLAGDFPAQNVVTGADLLGSIDEAVDLVNAGGGVSLCSAIFGHQRAGRKIAAEMRASGSLPPEVFVPRLGRKLMAVPTPHGWLPFVPCNFIDVGATSELTTLIMACLEGENAVHLAVPRETPEIRVTAVRADDRPQEMLIVELRAALLNISDGQAVRLTDFGPV